MTKPLALTWRLAAGLNVKTPWETMKDNISIQHQLQPYIFAALYNLVIEMSFHIFFLRIA